MDSVPPMDSKALKALEVYSWPGNVRELEHVIERAVIITQGSKLQLAEKLEPPDFVEPKEQSIDDMNEVERLHILKILERTNWKIEGKQGAANLLGLKPSTLRNRMVKLGIARLRDYPSNP